MNVRLWNLLDRRFEEPTVDISSSTLEIGRAHV